MGTYDRVRAFAGWLVARSGIRSERGASAVEYGIVASLIAAVIVAAVYFLGQTSSRQFSCTNSSIEFRNNPGGC